MDVYQKQLKPNGFYFNILFILYYLFLAPLVNRWVMFGEKNLFVAFLGCIVYITEFFAFNYKIKMVRLRAYSEAEEVGTPGCVLIYAVIIRFLFRIGFFMVSFMAFVDESNQGFFLGGLFFVVLFEVFVLLWTFGHTIFGNTDESKEEEEAERMKASIYLLNSQKSNIKEFLSDVILHLYAFMLITALWNPINESGREIVHQTAAAENSAMFSGLVLFFTYVIMSFLSLPAIRLAYWVEESTRALSSKDKWKLRGSFLLTAAVIASPVVQEYFKVFFQK